MSSGSGMNEEHVCLENIQPALGRRPAPFAGGLRHKCRFCLLVACGPVNIKAVLEVCAAQERVLGFAASRRRMLFVG